MQPRSPNWPNRRPKRPSSSRRNLSTVRAHAKSPGAATKRRKRKPVAIPRVRDKSNAARDRWLREERTLMEVVADLVTEHPEWSLLHLERHCELPYGTFKQMRHYPARRFGTKCERQMALHFGVPFIAAANPNQPIGELVEWEERVLAEPKVFT